MAARRGGDDEAEHAYLGTDSSLEGESMLPQQPVKPGVPFDGHGTVTSPVVGCLTDERNALVQHAEGKRGYAEPNISLEHRLFLSTTILRYCNRYDYPFEASRMTRAEGHP